MKNKLSLVIVNLLTITRLLGTIMLPIIARYSNVKVLIVYLILIFLTDTLDGFLARRLNVSTIFGAILDAFADKVFGIVTIYIISRSYPVMILPILVELLITFIKTDGATRGSGIESSYLGKFKTWVFGICTVMAYLVLYSADFIVMLESMNNYSLKIMDIFNYILDNDGVIMSGLAFIMIGADIMVTFDYINKVKDDTKKAKMTGIKRKNYRLKKGNDLYFVLFDHDYYIETKNQPLLVRIGEEVKNDSKN